MPVSLSLQSAIQQKLSAKFAFAESIHFTAVGGGSINDTYRIRFGERNAFCKMNSAIRFPQLFAKEKAGLKLIAKQKLIKTPEIIDCFEEAGTQVLMLEWVQAGERTEAFWKRFGEGLAALHRVSAEAFGLLENNYMGSVPQSNVRHKTWTAFFLAERLQPMIQRCLLNGQLNKTHLRQFENLEKRLSQIFEDENPSLLHGDLWSGNFMCDQNSEPVLIDPAVYFGHRSIDLAMTTLFGGFQSPFYESYRHHFPFPDNYEEQWAVCNLYPLLIHLYLFGTSYLPQIENTLQRFA